MKDRYNGYTIEEIEARLNPNMADCHKAEYMNNVREVIERQMSGFNLNEIENIKNTNFHITNLYLNNKNT